MLDPAHAHFRMTSSDAVPVTPVCLVLILYACTNSRI